MSGVRTVAWAIEDAAKSAPTRGFRFVPDAGVPGTPGVTETSEASFSFTAIERASRRYGGALQALGLKKGDRVALILPTNEDFILSFFGAVRAGIVPVPIYPPQGVGQLRAHLESARHIVDKSGARAILTTSRIKRLLGTVQAACPTLDTIVAVEAIRESMETLRPAQVTEDDVAFLQFTSGSTSRPKGVTVTHGSLVANIDGIMSEGLRANESDVGVSWLPLCHDMGLIGFVLAPLVYKVPVVFMPPLLFLKRPITWFQAMTRHRGTISYAPNFAYALCTKRIREKDLEGIDLSSWRIAGCGAEPIRPETLETFASTYERVGFRKEALLPSYGMAEAALAVTLSPLSRGLSTLSVAAEPLFGTGRVEPVAPAEATAGDEANPPVRIASCGIAIAKHAVQVFELDDATSATPLGEDRVGEIRVQGPSVMHGYWEDVERTRAAFAGGWLKTGDLGFLHGGEVYICGRSKEVVIVNGRNYYPQDLEWEASKVAGVRKGNVVAFGARDPSGIENDRERIVLAFELEDPTTHAPPVVTAVRRAVQDGTGLALDDVVALPRGALPKTSSGKLERVKTRALYETNELVPKPTRSDGRVEAAKHAARSQLSYLKLAVLGGRFRR